MRETESFGEVVSTDILVIGGGFGGLCAAIAVKEESPNIDVLIIEKCHTGWSGKANKGGGHLSFVTQDDDPEEMIRFYTTKSSCFLSDQELLREYAYSGQQVLERLASWGVPLFRNDDGSIRYVRMRPHLPWGTTAVDLDVNLRLHQTALKRGARVIDNVAMIDLLKDGDRVVGAIGFNIVDGTCYIIKAKATILANGGQNWRVMPRWSCGRGDGIAAAYRAGAEMRNAEFGSFFQLVYRANKIPAILAEDHLFNARGEYVSRKYVPDPEQESDISIKAILGWYQEVQAGNGPLYAASLSDKPYDPFPNLSKFMGVFDRPSFAAFSERFFNEKGKRAFKDLSKLEVVPCLIGEMSPVKVDHQMVTTLPGLLAIGDASYSGSAWAGAVPCPPGRMRGSGLMNAAFSALKAASASREIAEMSTEPRLDAGQIEKLKARMFAPMRRAHGVEPIEIIHATQDVMCQIKYSGLKSGARMRHALDRILDIKALIPRLGAKDTHYLAVCHEAEAMVLCAEMFFRASLERKESRGWFVREDFPEMDNKNWLRWVLLKDEDGGMVISTERIPIERYPIKP